MKIGKINIPTWALQGLAIGVTGYILKAAAEKGAEGMKEAGANVVSLVDPTSEKNIANQIFEYFYQKHPLKGVVYEEETSLGEDVADTFSAIQDGASNVYDSVSDWFGQIISGENNDVYTAQETAVRDSVEVDPVDYYSLHH